MLSHKSIVNKDTVSHHAEDKKINWDSSKIADFKGILHGKLEQLPFTVDGIVSGDSNIDDGVNNFANILYDSAFQILGQVGCHSCDIGSHRKQCKIGLIHSSAQSSTTFID